MNGMSSWINRVVVAIVLAGVASDALAQDMEWDRLPEPKHLAKVLDPVTFLRSGASDARLYVQVGAFQDRPRAAVQVARIKAAGLTAVLGREGQAILVLMPETANNKATILHGWARRSGYPDAYIRSLR